MVAVHEASPLAESRRWSEGRQEQWFVIFILTKISQSHCIRCAADNYITG